MTRLAGYDRNGDALSDTDVLSDDELAEDYSRRRLEPSGSSSDLVRQIRRAQLRIDEYGYDQHGDYHPERDGAA